MVEVLTDKINKKMNKNQNITIINGSELLSKLEQPLDELRTGVRKIGRASCRERVFYSV